MTILDTNVVSELMRLIPSPVVLAYLRRVDPDQMFTTSITEAEIRLGVVSLPAGNRRETLAMKMEILLDQEFRTRILPFDVGSARVYAHLVANRRRAGPPISIPDAQIAAIALSRNATLATRNVRDFELCQLPLINPWEQALPA